MNKETKIALKSVKTYIPFHYAAIQKYIDSMKKCPKCDKLYETLMLLLDEDIKYFSNKVKYRNQPMDNPWSEERIQEYNKTRIQGFKNRKDFITKYFNEGE